VAALFCVTGKSTLLNALAFRLDVNVEVSGEMRLNGRPYANSDLKRMSGYVMQDDLLNPNLTVRETLHYTAHLRLPSSMTVAERESRVEEVIREMGLGHCQHVIVGDPSKKGISGGERRRVCIGMELITRPTLLFMDEPSKKNRVEQNKHVKRNKQKNEKARARNTVGEGSRGLPRNRRAKHLRCFSFSP
jgi:ABC-type multidrug transport system ATPase subunit